MSHQLSVGIDVGSASHAIAMMDPNGRFCEEFTIAHNHTSFIQTVHKIKALANKLKAPVTVAIEGYNGYAAPFDRYLAKNGITVVAVNNLRFSRYREIFGQPYKNDAYDARLLADFISRQLEIDNRAGCQTIFLPSPEVAVIKKPARYQADLIRENTRYKLKLKKMAAEFFPELNQVYHDIFSANCLEFRL